jgi:chromosome segregation ATPase
VEDLAKGHQALGLELKGVREKAAGELAELKGELARKEEELLALAGTQEAIERDETVLIGELEEAGGAMARFEQEKEELEAKIGRLEGRCARDERQMRLLREEAAAAKDAAEAKEEEARRSLGQKDEELSRLKRDSGSLGDELLRIKRELAVAVDDAGAKEEEARRSLGQKDEELSRLKRDLGSTEEEARRNAGALGDELLRIKRELAAVKDDAGSAKRQHAREVDEAEEERARLKRSLADKEEELKNSERLLADNNSTMALLKASESDAAAHVSRLSAETAQKSQQLLLVQSQLNSLKDSVGAKDFKITTLQRSVENLETEAKRLVVPLEGRIEELQRELADKNAESKVKEGKILSLVAAGGGGEGGLAKELMREKETTEVHRKKAEELGKELAAAKVTIGTLTRTAESLEKFMKEDHQDEEAKIAMIAGQLKEAQEEIGQLLGANARLEERLRASEGRVSELEGELEVAKEDAKGVSDMEKIEELGFKLAAAEEEVRRQRALNEVEQKRVEDALMTVQHVVSAQKTVMTPKRERGGGGGGMGGTPMSREGRRLLSKVRGDPSTPLGSSSKGKPPRTPMATPPPPMSLGAAALSATENHSHVLQISELQKKVGEAEEEVNALNQSVKKAEQERDQVIGEKEGLKQRCFENETRFVEERVMRQDLEDKLYRADQKLARLQAEREGDAEDIAACRKQVLKLKADGRGREGEVEGLERAVREKEKGLRGLKWEVEELERDTAGLRERLKVVEGERGVLEESLNVSKSFESDEGLLIMELEKAGGVIKDLEETVEEKDAVISGLEGVNETLAAEVEELKEREKKDRESAELLSKVEGEEEVLIGQLEQAGDVITRLEAEIAELKERELLPVVEGEEEALVEQLEEAGDVIKRLEAEGAGLVEEAAKLRAANEALAEKFEEAKAVSGEMVNEVNASAELLSEVEGEEEALIEQLEEAGGTIKRLEAEVAELKEVANSRFLNIRFSCAHPPFARRRRRWRIPMFARRRRRRRTILWSSSSRPRCSSWSRKTGSSRKATRSRRPRWASTSARSRRRRPASFRTWRRRTPSSGSWRRARRSSSRTWMQRGPRFRRSRSRTSR